MLDAIHQRLDRVFGRERIERLHRASVAVIGVGLLGGQLLHHLAMLQVRTLLVDPGDVDAENLGNQLLPAAALGEPKVHVRAAQMKALNPTCPVRALRARVEDVGLGAFEGVDLLLSGLDGASSRLAVNRVAGQLGKDWVDAAVDGTGGRSLGTVSWLRPHRDDLACYGCRFGADDLAAAAREVRPQPCASWRNPGLPHTPPTLMASSFGSVVAGLQLNLALQTLLGETDGGAGQQLQISCSAGVPRVRRIELVRRSSCVFPHAPLERPRRAECATVGQLIERAGRDLGGAPEALVFPDRLLVFGLSCGICGAERALIKCCEAVSNDEARCQRCGAPEEMAPTALRNQLTAADFAAVSSRTWPELGLPPEDLVSAERAGRRVHYLLPASESRSREEIS